ncbi:uncharacterized protein [Apostichopus japonicus]|uniref:uncharacterized protein isoform X2 n=1 Tax=Stichopus japonicus TaxID=307972 RepID=UPI003AB61BE9
MIIFSTASIPPSTAPSVPTTEGPTSQLKTTPASIPPSTTPSVPTTEGPTSQPRTTTASIPPSTTLSVPTTEGPTSQPRTTTEIPSEIRRNVSTTDGVLNVTATIIDLTSVTNLLVRPERLVPLNSTGVYVFGVFQFGQLQGAVIVIVEDKCTPNPCQNNGKCIAEDYGVTCQCDFGYRGDYCREPANPCTDNVPVPCNGNVESCFFRPGSNDTTCIEGWVNDVETVPTDLMTT